MTSDSSAQGSQHNTITGSGNIVTGGTFSKSPVSSTTIAPGSAAAGPQEVWVEKLRDELAKVRQRLADPRLPDASTDLDDARTAVEGLQQGLAGPASPEVSTMDRLRLRVKELLGALAPVAEIIGGVAAFEEIWRHL